MQIQSIRESEPGPVPGWADDIAVMIPMGEAAQVVESLKETVSIVEEESRFIGVNLNFESGKTEALLVLRGRRNMSVRRELLAPSEPGLDITLCDGRNVRLRVVEAYKHLGSLVSHTASCREDIVARGRAAELIFKRLQHTLLRNPALEHHEKTYLVRSLVVNKFCYNAGLWVFTARSDEALYKSTLMSYYRRSVWPILQISTKFLTDLEVCASLKVLPPLDILRVERVRQLRSVVYHDAGFLWELVVHASLWLEHALEDLREVLHELMLDWGELKPTASCLDSLMVRFRGDRQLLKRFAQSRIRRQQQLQETALAKASLIHRIARIGGVVVHIPPRDSHAAFECQTCGVKLKSKAGLAAHSPLAHNLRAPTSGIAGSRCAVCCKEYWSTHRLRTHLAKSVRCGLVYQHSDIQGYNSYEIAGSKHQRAWRPPTTTFGPQEWWATQVFTEPPCPVNRPVEKARVELQLKDLLDAAGKLLTEDWCTSLLRFVSRFPDRLHVSGVQSRHPFGAIVEQLKEIVANAFRTKFERVEAKAGAFNILCDGSLIWVAPA